MEVSVFGDPPHAGAFVLHFPESDRGASPPMEVVVEDRGDGVLVWADPYTGSTFGTHPYLPRLSRDHRWLVLVQP